MGDQDAQGQLNARARAVRPLGPGRRDPLRRPRGPVVDLERAEPPRVPRPQYKDGKPHSPALYRKLYAPASARSTAFAAARATRSCSARPRRSATRTSSRRSRSCAARCAWTRATRRRELQEAALDGYAHHAYTRKPARSSSPPTTTRSASARSAGSSPRSTRRPAGAIDAPRIYLTEFGIQSSPTSSRVCARPPGRVPRDLREDRLRQPAREGVLAVPAARRPAAQGFEVALPASRPAAVVEGQRKSPPTTRSSCRSSPPGTAPSDVLWGRVRPATDRPRSRSSTRSARGVEAPHGAPTSGVYGFRTEHQLQAALPRQVDAPRRREAHRPADPGLLSGAAAALCSRVPRSNLPPPWPNSAALAPAPRRGRARTNPSPTSSAS